MKALLRRALGLGLAAAGWAACAQSNALDPASIFQHPLSRAAAVETALRHNTSIRKGQADLEAAHGVVLQLRSIGYPVLSAGGGFNREQSTLVEGFPIPAPFNTIRFPDENWNADVRVQQSIYQGGRIRSSFRSAKLTREQALLNYQTVLADTLLAVRVAYDDVLVARQQVQVHEASVKLLSNELDQVIRRFDAGKVPRFDLLRARVELANETPRLIQARNALRIGKNTLLNLLGCDLPPAFSEDIPLELSDTLMAGPLVLDLPSALLQAAQTRPELASLKKAELLRQEEVVRAKSGYKPTAQIFGGYQWNSLPYEDRIGDDLYGWTTGVQVSWNLFDGGLTRGKILEAQARYEHARLDLEETRRQIELDVRTAWSGFIEAREVLESQKTVQEEAEEALRLAEARMEAGTGTQLEVLDSQTSLTQARTTQVQALHDYSVARARVLRATGADMEIVQK